MAKAKKPRTTVVRDDVPAKGWAPPGIRQFLVRVGGLNPFREPNYRLVLAQHVLQQAGGEFNEYPDDATLSERGGIELAPAEIEVEVEADPRSGKSATVKHGKQLINLGPSSSKLLRTVVEMRWEPRYPNIEGWMLQRWYPATHPAFGDRETWEKLTLKARPDILLLGPFPIYGEYEPCSVWMEEKGGKAIVSPCESHEGLTGLCLKEIPPLRVLHKAILAAEDASLDLRSLAATRGARIRMRLNEWIARNEERRAKRKIRNIQFIHDHMKPYWGTSLESARLREMLAPKAGIRTHVGA